MATTKKAVVEEGYEDKVKIRLFKDNDKYKDDVTVGINGKITRIKRGVWVEVSRAVKEILDHQEEQDIQTAEMMTAQENDFLSKEKDYI